MNQIPSVDLRDFLSDNEQTKSMFVQTIGKAFQEIGFCAVRGHFLDDDLANRLYSQIKLLGYNKDEGKKEISIEYGDYKIVSVFTEETGCYFKK